MPQIWEDEVLGYFDNLQQEAFGVIYDHIIYTVSKSPAVAVMPNNRSRDILRTDVFG